MSQKKRLIDYYKHELTDKENLFRHIVNSLDDTRLEEIIERFNSIYPQNRGDYPISCLEHENIMPLNDYLTEVEGMTDIDPPIHEAISICADCTTEIIT